MYIYFKLMKQYNQKFDLNFSICHRKPLASGKYCKIANSSLFQLVARYQIFRRLMEEKFDANVLWPLAYCSQLYGTLYFVMIIELDNEILKFLQLFCYWQCKQIIKGRQINSNWSFNCKSNQSFFKTTSLLLSSWCLLGNRNSFFFSFDFSTLCLLAQWCLFPW